MNKIGSVGELEAIFGRFFKKGTHTNNYILAAEYESHIYAECLYVHVDDNNAFLFLDKGHALRLYYFINDIKQTLRLTLDRPVVLEILYRGEQHFPTTEVDFFIRSGFVKHLTRDCLALAANKIPDEAFLNDIPKSITVGFAVSNDAVKQAYELFDQNLDLLTGDWMSESGVAAAAASQQLFCAYQDGEPAGYLHAEMKHSVYWLRHVVVEAKYRGRGMGEVLLKHYLSSGKAISCRQYQLWVIKENVPAYKLYEKAGFAYFNRSTYSLIKK